MTGKEILEREFEKAGMRGGYRADQVDDFLKEIAAYIDEQNVEKENMTYKMKVLAEKIEEYKSDEANIRDALLSAQKLGTSILSESKTKAEAMLNEAQSTYDSLMSQAKSKVDALTRESMQKATLDLNELKKETDRERVTLERLKKEVSSFKATILKQYKNHLDLLTSLPDFEPPQRRDESEAAAAPAEQPQQRRIEQEIQDDRESQEANARRAARERREQEMQEQERKQLELEKRRREEQAERLERTAELEDAANSSDEFQVSEETEDQEVFVRPQTITSEILTNEKELLEDEQEQTIEFGKESGEEKQETFKTDLGVPPRKRPNYLEKFGELKFGSFDDNK